MFLRSLSLKGFKSFADRTVVEFEPGITVIVGPNGSGKSNVVDALAWVLGTRSAKLLRGGELADVIFAGSPARPAAGHAAVEIVIDNSRGQLGRGAVGLGGSAQEFAEVRIGREILPDGQNVYAINGVECRLLDVQELLSDTGLGRELHTVVGQGQVDAILQAKPEDRRAFVEEAAGILKHRRRRERAQRKLEHVDRHVEQLRGLLRELRRQLRPLERQAEAANRHAQLQAELREVQVRLAVHDLLRLREVAAREDAHDTATVARQRELDSAVAGLETAIAAAEAELQGDAPRAERARATAERLARLRERLGGTTDLIDARHRHLLEYVDEPLAGRPPDELRAQADRLDRQRECRATALARARSELAVAARASRAAQLTARERERAVAAAAHARAEAHERYVRWEGEVRSHRQAAAATATETERLIAQLADLDARAAGLRGEVDAVQDRIRRLDAAEQRHADALERAEASVAAAEAGLEAAVARAHELERERASHAARAQALRAVSAESPDGAAALLGSELDGVLGRLADHVRVRPGGEGAVAAALGPLGEAVVARSTRHAARAVAHLRGSRSGRAVVLPARTGHTPAPADAPDGARPLAELLAPNGPDPAGILAAVQRALAATFVVGGWERAVVLHEDHPELTFVTPDGDVAGPAGFAGGCDPQPSAVVTAAAAEHAERRVETLDADIQQATAQVQGARAELTRRRGGLAAATRTINESDARITGAAEQLARLHRELESNERQSDLIRARVEELTAAVERHHQAVRELEAEEVPQPSEQEPAADGDLQAELVERDLERARETELAARLTVERLDEQVDQLGRAVADLRREAAEVERSLADAARRRELRRRHVRRCGELAAVAQQAAAVLERSMRDARAERDRLDRARAAREADLAATRADLRERAAELDRVREERHAADLRRAEVRHELEQLQRRLRDGFGLPPGDAVAQQPEAASASRDELVAAEEALVRKVDVLGRINPLALEQFTALEDRHRFLSGQLDDLLRGRHDLDEVIRAVDDRIREVFHEAFVDVAREFATVIQALFPGGDGRLLLTDPDDLLATGIEVEVRPPGKRVKRLSLLSGGERSLAALAFLFAIFRARPSPFYVLDEVDAALDDVNLQRLLRLLESFKTTSQLLVVTHQKRTMEVADLLIGVTMGADAVSKVVAERLREPVAPG